LLAGLKAEAVEAGTLGIVLDIAAGEDIHLPGMAEYTTWKHRSVIVITWVIDNFPR
jgi:hypothetical protein